MIQALRRRWQAHRAPDDLHLPGLFSRAALLRAWAQVRANKGTAGVDGIGIPEFERELERHLAKLQAELVEGTYRPQPIKQVLVPKPAGGLRPLAIWAVRDRIAQRVVYEYLEPLFEPMFLECSFGFRSGRSAADAIQRVVHYRDLHHRWVLDADIRKCFDRISPRLLMRLVRRRVYHPEILSLLRGWLRAPIWNTADGRAAVAGVSQGSVLAPLLCNIYLHEFDRGMTEKGYQLVRYADDWLVLCRHKREATAAERHAARVLHRLELALHPEKTRIVHFDEGFTFLGYFMVRNEVYRL